MSIYFIFFFIFYLLSIIKKFEINRSNFYNKKKIIFLTFLFLFIFIGLRDGVGGDDVRYQEYYEAVKSGIETSASNESKEKPFFYLINKFASLFDFGYILSVSFFSFIFSISLILFCIYSGNLFFGLMLAMPILIIVMSMGYVTQSVALAFLMLAYVQFIKERVLFFIIFILIGAMFHPSIIVFLGMILLSFLNPKKLTISILAGILVIIFIFNVIFESYLIEQFDNYVGDKLESGGFVFRSVFNLISIFIFFIFINKKELEKIYKILFYFFSISSSLLFLLYLASIPSTAIDRMALYLIPIQILIINKFLNDYYSANSRKIVSFIFFIIYFIYMLIWFNFSNFSSYWVPYKNILF